METYLTRKQEMLRTRNESIYKLYKGGMNMAKIARKYGISRQRIHQIITLWITLDK